MYDSPIEVIYQDIQCGLEEGILKACQNINVNVNNEELFKALQFDRDQYQRGYYDGLNERKKGEWLDTETSYADGVRQECRCSVCSRLSPRPLGIFADGVERI